MVPYEPGAHPPEGGGDRLAGELVLVPLYRLPRCHDGRLLRVLAGQVSLDADGNPAFVVLMSDSTPTDCVFHFIKRQGGEWGKTPIARTVTNIRSGARSPVAGMLHAVFVLLFMLIFP